MALQGDLRQAVNVFRQVVAQNPDNSEAYYNLGSVLGDMGQLSEAGQMFRRAIQMNPNQPKYYNNLGVVLEKAKLLSQASELFAWAVKLDPRYTEAVNNFGTVLMDTGQIDEAEVYFRRALELNPHFAKTYNNLGMVLENKNCRGEALRCFQRATELEPDNAIFYKNLGKMLRDSHHLDEAEVCFKHALQLQPDFADADLALAILYLLQAQYDKGWEKYDDLRLVKTRSKKLPIPRWRGEPLTNRRILLYADQGFGDTIHFVRYAQMVSELAGETHLLVQKPLRRLLECSLTTCQICDSGSIMANEYDFASPLLSLPHIFHTSQDTIPRKIPYLQPPHTDVDNWRRKLKGSDKDKKYQIGIVWAGNSAHSNDRNRSIPFDVFSRLFDIAGAAEVNWVSLQVGKRAEDVIRIPDQVVNLAADLVDFAATAGVIANLDMVITVDSAVAHLAGAMGQKAWLLLPFNPDWRWQLDREDSPWYPTLRLFRQREMDTWPEVLGRVKKFLRNFLYSTS